MARQRSINIWHVPKRSSLHQMIGAVNIIQKLPIHGKTWPENRKLFDQKLAMWGFTTRGRSLSKTASETLEALMKYLGLVVIRNDHIYLTTCGRRLAAEHPVSEPSRKKRRLPDTIKQMGKQISSQVIANQMLKLNMTNPSIMRYCENVHLYPFRETLLLLLDSKIGYLTQEEIGYILFHMKSDTERDQIKKRILHFRSLKQSKKNSLIENYGKTLEGNLTLVQAGTAGYWRQLCENTGLCFSQNQTLKIQAGKEQEISKLLSEFSDNFYDFKKEQDLWTTYFCSCEIKAPPIHTTIEIKGDLSNLFLSITKDGQRPLLTLIDNNTINATLFPNLPYEIEIYDIMNEEVIKKITHTFSRQKKVVIPIQRKKSISNTGSYEQKILELLQSPDYDPFYKQLIHVISVKSGRDFEDKKQRASLRGGRLEQLFSKLLKKLEEDGKISNLDWNGRIDRFSLARPALGTQQGLPDLTFQCNKIQYLIELTTIRGATGQWKNEGMSVPFHIRNFIMEKGITNVKGIFCVPMTHQKVKDSLDASRFPVHYNISYITIEEFLKILSESDLKTKLENL